MSQGRVPPPTTINCALRLKPGFVVIIRDIPRNLCVPTESGFTCEGYSITGNELHYMNTEILKDLHVFFDVIKSKTTTWDVIKNIAIYNQILDGLTLTPTENNKKEEVCQSCSERTTLLCLVCLASEREWMAMDCCHVCLCNSCYRKMWDQNCPVCRGPTNKYTRVYL